MGRVGYWAAGPLPKKRRGVRPSTISVFERDEGVVVRDTQYAPSEDAGGQAGRTSSYRIHQLSPPCTLPGPCRSARSSAAPRGDNRYPTSRLSVSPSAFSFLTLILNAKRS